jgi:small subunit ribosomal protein S27Ae
MAKEKSTSSKRWEKYKDGKAQARFCPRCGPGIFLAKMKGRLYCGKCAYTEFSKE